MDDRLSNLAKACVSSISGKETDLSENSSLLIRTLLGSRFQLVSGTRKPSYMLLEMQRFDEFGHKTTYFFAHCDKKLVDSEVYGLKALAEGKSSSLVIIGEIEEPTENVVCISENKLLGKLGGAIQSFLPLEEEYGERLVELGRNSLPAGLNGEADDLFEIYVQQGLEFLLQERVVRYGQGRNFEVVPDGIIAASSFVVLYDCKAASGGYAFDRDSIRQFSDYANAFRDRYSAYAPKLHSFLVVSGYFKSPQTLAERSAELYSQCQVPLTCLTSDEMRKVIELFVVQPQFRRAIDWKRILASNIITFDTFKKNLEERKKDKVISSEVEDGNLS